MFSLADLGLEPSLISIIVGQAALVLIACSVLLPVVKDLYDVRIISFGLPGEPRTKRHIPAVEGLCADRLRFFIRLFSMLLPTAYFFLALLVTFVELKGQTVVLEGKATKFVQFVIFDGSPLGLTLRWVYNFELLLHFFIIIIVATIFFWTVGVRKQVLGRRLQETPE